MNDMEALIEQLLQQREQPIGLDEAVLTSGPWVDAMPMAIWLDPRLDPYDRSVFGALWAIVKRRGTHALMPSYDEIARYTGIRSRDRISRSISALRLTRWITLIERARDELGRNRGNAYLLNSEPVHIADIMSVDREYVRFLRLTATAHRTRKLRNLALEALEELEQRENPLEPPTGRERIAGQISTMFAVGQGIAPEECKTQVRITNSDRVRDTNLDRVRITNPARVRNTNSGTNSVSGCSSSDLYIKTTTPPISPPSLESLELGPDEFEWPDFLEGAEHENLRELITRQLAKLPEPQRQPMLDELAGQMRYREKLGDPIRSPVGYFRRMCERFQAGDGGPGGHADAERKLRAAKRRMQRIEAESQKRARRELGAGTPASERPETQDSDIALEAIKEMRQLFGLGPRDPG